MRTKVVVILLIAVALTGLELFYFKFHTYFQKTEINEELPLMTSPGEQEMGQMRTLAMGEFGEIDIIHKGSGQAKLIEVNGETILRLENFSVTSGPDLYVYLSDSENPTNALRDLGNYVDLGLLKATSGNQNYTIPASAEGLRTAVIWCKKFGVLFSYAVMK